MAAVAALVFTGFALADGPPPKPLPHTRPQSSAVPFGSGTVAKYGGPTMNTVTIHAVFWHYDYDGFTFPSGFETAVDNYLAGVASGSGLGSNVYGVLKQYGKYTINFGGGVDYNYSPFPPPLCPVAVAGGSCLDFGNLEGWIDGIRLDEHLSVGLTNAFLLFLPPKENTCLFDGTPDQVCVSDPACLSYHSAYTSDNDGQLIIWAVVPSLPELCHSPDGTTIQPEPRGGPADIAIDAAEENLINMLTDPLGNGWHDSAGYEIGSKCAYQFGSALQGHPNANQIIGGAEFWTPLLYSNAKHGCYQTGPPIISSLPAGAKVGDAVTISGANLSDATSVTIGTHAMTFTQSADDEIDAVMPSSGVTGKITVTGRFGTSTSSGLVTLLPDVQTFSPAHGPVGTAVTITGNQLAAARKVTVGGSAAAISHTGGSLRAVVPANAVTGPIQAGGAVLTTVPGGSFVVDPTISSMTPTVAHVGSTVTLSGSGFGAGGESRVIKVGSVAASDLTWISPNTVRFAVPPGASTGLVSIAVSGHAPASSAKALSVPANVTGYDQPTYKAGDAVTILGSNLDGATSVSFGTVQAPVFSVAGDGSSISTTVPDTAMTGPVVIVTPQGTAKGPIVHIVPTLFPLPSQEGPTGAVLMVTGNTFVGIKTVTVGGALAVFKVLSPTSLQVTIPVAAETGSVAVTNAGGTTASVDLYTVDPVITGFTPSAAGAGKVVTVSGSGFGANGETRVVRIGSVIAAGVTWMSPNKLQVVVPVGARTGAISINVSAGAVTAHSVQLLVVPPDIVGYDQPTYQAGDPITIDGNNLDGATSVSFGKVVVGSFTVALDGNSIATTVPSDALTGPVTVLTPAGTAVGPTVHVAPTIGDFSPHDAAAGQIVTITGNTFTGTTAVLFGSAKAAFQIVGPQTLTATVPAGASTAHISVTNAGGTTASSQTFTPHPHMTSFSPTSGPTGATVSITGSGLDAATAVKFETLTGPVSAVISSVSPTALQVKVPDGAVPGHVELDSDFGNQTSATSFAVTFSATAIQYDDESSGSPDSITGIGLPGVTGMAINGIPVTQWSVSDPNTLSFIVPTVSGSQDLNGPITIAKGSTTIELATSFSWLHVATSTPIFPAPSTTVTLHGSGFLEAHDVGFSNGSGWDHVTSFSVSDDGTSVTVTMPADYNGSEAAVFLPNGTYAFMFLGFMRITELEPPSVAVGDTIQISGIGIANVTQVTFNGIPATSFTQVSSIRVDAVVPPGATSGTVAVTADGGTATHAVTLVPTAQLQINEVATNLASGQSLVELKALTGGALEHIQLVLTPHSNPTSLATFPYVTVQAGDLIVVHLNPPSDAGTETQSKNQWQHYYNPDEYDTAWDVAGGTTIIPYDDEVLAVEAPGGAVMDAVALARPSLGATPASFRADLAWIQGLSQWDPADCGGSACTDATTPAATDVSADWDGLGTVLTGNTAQRSGNADTNQGSDWVVQAGTMAATNP